MLIMIIVITAAAATAQQIPATHNDKVFWWKLHKLTALICLGEERSFHDDQDRDDAKCW